MPVLNRYRNDVANLDRLYEDYLKLAAPQGRVFVFLDEVQFFRTGRSLSSPATNGETSSSW